MSKPKYLLLGDGGSPHLIKWIRELVKYFEVYLISLRRIHADISGMVAVDHLFYISNRWDSAGGNLGFLVHIAKITAIIKKVNPDFVNAHYLSSYGLVAALARQFQSGKFFLIQSAWGTDILVTPDKNWLYSVSARYSLNKAQLITSDSDFMSTRIRQFTKTPVLTFTFGLDSLPDFEKTQKQKGLFFSNRILSDNYNIDEIIHFFSGIAVHEDEARLIIANDGEKRLELENLVNRLHLESKVSFCGFLSSDDLEEWYKKAEFFISIPTSDSTSVSLLEAMAHGCIPVVSDIPVNHEWIRDESQGIFYTRDLSYETLKKFRLKMNEATEKNRRIISEKAIFPDSILDFAKYLIKQTGGSLV